MKPSKARVEKESSLPYRPTPGEGVQWVCVVCGRAGDTKRSVLEQNPGCMSFNVREFWSRSLEIDLRTSRVIGGVEVRR